jgi:Ca-activated chloride channel family protein
MNLDRMISEIVLLYVKLILKNMRFLYQEWSERFGNNPDKSSFDKLFDLFKQLLYISSGDVAQALRWLTELDKEYNITKDSEYGMADFIKDLEDQGYINYDEEAVKVVITKKTERHLRTNALDEIFKNLKKGNIGGHKTTYSGKGAERQPETRMWNFGDDLNQMDQTGTLMNALKNHGPEFFQITEEDLQIHESDHNTSVATVLMIDLSHSMILYGEDRITPAKKVAMALAELILNGYAKDSLDIIAFGNDVWPVTIDELPYLKVGPFHTNTHGGLQLARHQLQRRKHANKQIFMITDGKPSAMYENGKLYKNSFGLDRKIVNKVLDEAVKCRREKITITTFMIAQDPYLQNFVRELTEANKGRAYFAGLDNLGGYVLEDYVRNRRKKV